MTALVLFPSRIRFVNPDGTLTPEAFRALNELINRTGGVLGDVGVDTEADVIGSGLTNSSINIAYTDVQQPQSEALLQAHIIQQPQSEPRLIAELLQQTTSQDMLLPDVVQPPFMPEYEEYTSISTACTGVITTACVWKLTKQGNVITLTLPNVQGTAAATTNFTVGETIPAKYRPTADLAVRGGVQINNAIALSQPPMIKVLTTGVISVWADGLETVNYTAGANAGLKYATSLTWNL